MSDIETDSPSIPVGWPAWAATLKPHIPARNLNLFERFTAWMEKNAPTVWEGQLSLLLENEAHADLRKKLGNPGRHNRWIETVHGVGYRVTG